MTPPAIETPRTLSAEAKDALNSFARLRGFFRSDVQLAEALGWSEDTVRAWRQRTIKRPQVGNREQVTALLLLCDEARRWAINDLDVGNWSLEPQDRLRGAAPAAFACQLGEDGTRRLLEGFSLIAPRVHAGEPPNYSREDLESILANALKIGDGQAIRPAEPQEADLSDFD